MTPTSTSVLPYGNPATAANSRTYSVAVPAGTVVDLALFASSNVMVDANGVVTFADTNSDNIADVGTITGAKFTQVNGINLSAQTKNDVTSTGTVTFTVTATQAASVVPVVFSKADGNDQVDLTVPLTANPDPKTATDSIGVGGVTIFTVAQAGLGASTPTVATFNTTENYFASTSASYNYDANDTYQFGGQPITMTQFEAALVAGDVVSVSYSPTASGVSVFNMTTEATPAAVTAISAAAVNVDAGATINDVQVTYTRPTNASGVTYTLQRKATGAADSTFVTVTTATQAAGSTDTEFVFTTTNLANLAGGYTFRVEATSPISGTVTDGTQSGTVVIPGTPNTTPPISTYAAETTVAGLANTVDTGDVFKVVFSATMAVPAAGATIRASDGDGTIADLVNGTNATFTVNTAVETVNAVSRAVGTVLTVTITGAPTVVATGTTAGLQLPAIMIDSANIKGTNGVNWDVASSTGKTL